MMNCWHVLPVRLHVYFLLMPKKHAALPSTYGRNINGLGNTLPNIQLAHKGLKGFFQHLGAHAICFQECKMPESKMSKEVVMVDGYESFWAVSQPPKTGYSGCTTYVHKQYSPTAAEADNLGSSVAAELGQDDFFGDRPDIDKEGRFVLTDLAEFVLINVYVPNAGDHTGRARLGFKCR
ncbi:hypothetical protein DUNSADRAFT_3338 [Dunaliella salina]|uniref:Uncharacterized protein n=1 Tax=Dunaliella salina TaxID=3046 RepID=A0ABQ7GU54_DUNSA|nr:hypothetical protein DUNSADRAFT_3338 [Dunaliella salina]|eukprot:KAF5838143.1 hypothetical protein DUNSADRAFT_3338 [Dunaliella salina]